MNINKLSLNVTKTEYLIIASGNRLSNITQNPKLYLGNKFIKRVSIVKTLGIYVDERLSWSKHIDLLSKKVSSAIGALKRIREFVPFQTSLVIYNALIQSHFG